MFRSKGGAKHRGANHLSVKQNRCEPSQRETYLGAKHPVPEVKCAIDLHRIYANIFKLDTTIN